MDDKEKKELARARMCAEVLECLRHATKEELDKIPKRVLQAFEKCADKNYHVYIDMGKMLCEQNISEDAKNIMYVLWRYYWADPEEQKEFDAVVERNTIKYKEEQYRKMLEEEEENN